MTLSHEIADRITMLHRAAKRSGSLVSVQELGHLLDERASESELAEAIGSIPALNSRFELREGYLTERGKDDLLMVELEARSRKRAQVNLKYATRFLSFLRSSPFEMLAVSGSTSYGSASRSKDLDFFCVAPKGRMWVSITQGLLMARAFAIANRSAPRICLSCIMDEEFALSSFASERNPLFARDAIEAKVLRGSDVYRSLVGSARWISGFYPLAYDGIMSAGRTAGPGSEPSPWDRVLNSLLLASVGRYMRLKAALLNRRLRAGGRGEDVFVLRHGEDHLIYESGYYSSLRGEYGRAMLNGSKESPARP